MTIQKTGDSRLSLARQQFQERCQVLRADDLVREGSVEQVKVFKRFDRRIAFRRERFDGTNSPGSVNEVDRGAEEARQSVGQSQPARVRPGR